MSSKSLDQLGRTGVYDHFICRKATIVDIGLGSVKDVAKHADLLPLTGDGVLGKGFEIKLKDRKENNKSCRRTASSPAGYILYCDIFIIKPYNIGHTDLDVFVCKSFCHIDIIIKV